jgi:hypothetical protein
MGDGYLGKARLQEKISQGFMLREKFCLSKNLASNN